jgi:hypothetical protein
LLGAVCWVLHRLWWLPIWNRSALLACPIAWACSRSLRFDRWYWQRPNQGGHTVAEAICPKCRHARRAHSKDGCIEWLEPISSGKECSCKRKYTDGGWVHGNPKVG